MKTIPTAIPDLQLVEPNFFGDERGYFMEVYKQPEFSRLSLDCRFVQDNLSWSRSGVLRGLHYQLAANGPRGGMAKLVRVVRGRILDVVVDLRRDSATFAQAVATELSDTNRRSLMVPAGFAHGFYALEESHVFYSCSDVYRQDREYGLLWNDPTLAIDWPNPKPLLSPKDAAQPRLVDIPDENLPRL